MKAGLTVLVLISQVPTYLVTNIEYPGRVICSCRNQKQTCFNNTDVTFNYGNHITDKETFDFCDDIVIMSLVKLNAQIIHRFLSSRSSGSIIFLTISFSESLEVVGSKLFENMHQLKELNLLHSNIAKIPRKMFWNLKELKVLNLNTNKLKMLQKHSFLDVCNLRELHLKKNEISKIESRVFEHLIYLRILNLAANRLEHVLAVTFAGLENLRTLIISDNHILHFSINILMPLKKLELLDLSGNPLEVIPKPVKQIEIIYRENELEIQRNGFDVEYLILLLLLGIIAVIFMVLLLKYMKTHKNKHNLNHIYIYLLYAEQDDVYALNLKEKLEDVLNADIVTVADNEAGNVTQEEIIDKVSKCDVLIIIISQHFNSIMDLVISRFCDSPVKIKQKVSFLLVCFLIHYIVQTFRSQYQYCSVKTMIFELEIKI